MHTSPSYLFNGASVEFFTDKQARALCITNGEILPFIRFGDAVLQIVENDIAINSVKARALTAMGLTERLPRIEKYLVCNYGGFDHHPDMLNGVLMHTEYWACPNRGKCKFEGVLCDGLKTASGEMLSVREIQVLKLVATGLLDKEIAETLQISIHTVPTHTRNIRRKTMLMRKADLTRYATQKNLI